MDNITTIADETSGSFTSSAVTSGALTSNTQAMMEFVNIWAAGCRNISDIMTSASQAHFDHMTTTMKAMSDVRTVKGAMELQMAATRTSIEQAVAHSSKLTSASMELADQGMAPLKARVEATMARFGSTRPA